MIYLSNFPITNDIIFEKLYLFICSLLLVTRQNKESLIPLESSIRFVLIMTVSFEVPLTIRTGL